ncbi:MAG: virulence factor [Rhodobacteraceae bacterium]|nr:virulence factor [Paracoccaceae bacterium]
MPQLVVKFWRDIPSMVSVGRGRSAAKRQLPELFEQAIDRCAMKVGAKDDDAYLAEWRNDARGEVEGDPQQVADQTAAELESQYNVDKIKALIANDGWDTDRADG